MRLVIAYVVDMRTITAEDAAVNLEQIIAGFSGVDDPIVIVGKRKNAVLISEDTWISVQETLYLQSIPGMVESVQNGQKAGLKEASTEPTW